MPAKKKAIEVADVSNTQTTTTAKPVTKRKYTKKTTNTEALITTPIKVDEVGVTSTTNKIEELVSSELSNTLESSTNDKEPMSNSLPDGDSEDKNKKKSKNSTNTQVRKVKQQKVNVQDEFYERVIVDKIQVTIHLNKIKVTGVITHHDMFCIVLESNGQQQVIYKQTISFISAPMKFKKPFVRRDRPFYYTNENTVNQSTNRLTATPSQTNYNKVNTRENTFSQGSQGSHVQTSRDTTENRPARTYSSANSSTFQTIKSDTDKSSLGSNKSIAEKFQVQSQPNPQNSEQELSAQQVGSKPSIYSKATNNQQNQAGKNEPNNAGKVFRVQSTPNPTTKAKK